MVDRCSAGVTAPTPPEGDPVTAPDLLVGREGLLDGLATALRSNRVAVLHGPAGTGVTTTATAFGQRWSRTGGSQLPDPVIYHSSRSGLASRNLDGLIATAGTRAFGPEFSRVGSGQRRGMVVRFLSQHPVLLLWDDFESVVTGHEEIAAFLAELAREGAGAVLLAGRDAADWLDPAVPRLAHGGLAPDEARVLAGRVLARCPGAGRHPAAAVDQVRDLLHGHPAALRLVLPRLGVHDPLLVVRLLRSAGAGPDGDPGTALDAALRCCLDLIPDHGDRQVLRALALLDDVADLDVLAAFSRSEHAPEPFAGRRRRHWREALEAAASTGIVDPLGGGMYRIHPGLPAVLDRLWRGEAGPAHPAEHAASGRALLEAYASFGTWLVQQIDGGNAGTAFALLDRHEPALAALLARAIELGDHRAAQDLLEPLNDYWDARGTTGEAAAWLATVRAATEPAAAHVLDPETAAGALWLFSATAQADRDRGEGRLERAEAAYHDLIERLDAGAATARQHATRLRRSLCATRQARQVLDRTCDWYRRPLPVAEVLAGQHDLARGYHQLGLVAHARGDLAEARAWYRRSLAVNQELGHLPGTAGSLHALGTVAEARGQLYEARDWYQAALAASERLAHRGAMACTHHHLGRLAQTGGFLDGAERSYLRSLTLTAELDDRPGLARTYGQLGLLARDRRLLPDALEWTVRCAAVFEEFPHPATGPGPRHLRRLAGELGLPALENCWHQVAGAPVPEPVREYVLTGAVSGAAGTG